MSNKHGYVTKHRSCVPVSREDWQHSTHVRYPARVYKLSSTSCFVKDGGRCDDPRASPADRSSLPPPRLPANERRHDNPFAAARENRGSSDLSTSYTDSSDSDYEGVIFIACTFHTPLEMHRIVVEYSLRGSINTGRTFRMSRECPWRTQDSTFLQDISKLATIQLQHF